MSFMQGVDITRAIGRAGLKVEPVLGPEIARATARKIWAQNRLDFQTKPSNGPRNVNAPHKTQKAPRHIINSLINSYYATETYFTHFLEEARFPKAPGFSEALST